MGVAITMPSIESDSTSSRAEVVKRIPGLSHFTDSSLSSLWSATAATRQPGTFAMFRIRFGPQYPHPITPMLIIIVCPQKHPCTRRPDSPHTPPALFPIPGTWVETRPVLHTARPPDSGELKNVEKPLSGESLADNEFQFRLRDPAN